MNTNELYIAGRKVSIGAGQVVALTKQINSIGEIQSRQANLSNTFRVDYFDDNEKHLNFAGRPGSQTLYPYRFLPARYVQNGFEIVRNGNAVIKATGEKAAEISLYWGNNDFFDRLNFQLSELDLSELNHVFTRFVLAAGLNPNISYPFMEFGNNSIYRYTDAGVNYTLVDILKAFPAVKTKYLIDKIAERIGLNFEGEILESTGLNMEALQLLTKKSDIENKQAIFVKSEWNDFSPGTGEGTFAWFKHQNIINGGLSGSFPAQFGATGSTGQNTGFINQTGKRVLMRFRVILNMTFEQNNTSDPFIFRVVKGDGSTATEFQEPEEFTSPRVYEFDIDMLQGEGFRLYLWAKGFNTIQLFPGSSFEMIDVSIPELGIGDTYTVAFNMPEITAFEFIQNVAQRYGVFFETENKTVQWVTFDDVLKSKGEKNILPFDLIPNRRKTDFNPGNYFQENRIEYQEGNTEELFASFRIDNKTLSEVDTILSFNTYLPSYINKAEVGRVVAVALFSEALERQNIKTPFIYIQNRTTTTPGDGDLNPVIYGYSVGNLNETGTEFITFDIAKFAILETTGSRRGSAVTSGVTPRVIVDVYYKSLRQILDRFERHTFFSYMNEVQFNAVSNRKAYFVKELNSFVYLEKVANFVPDRPTQISMIKI
jgi:hypothetical protein